MSPRRYWPNKEEMEKIMPVPLGTCRYRIRHNMEDPPFIEQAEVVGAQLFYHPPANPRWLLNTKISPYFEAHEASDVSCYWSRLTMTDFMNNFTDDLPALQAQVPPLKWPSDTVQIVPVASACGVLRTLSSHLSNHWTTLGPLTWEGFTDFSSPIITEKDHVRRMAPVYSFQTYYRADDTLRSLMLSADMQEEMDDGIISHMAADSRNVFMVPWGISVYYLRDEEPLLLKGPIRMDHAITANGSSYIVTARGFVVEDDPSKVIKMEEKRVAEVQLRRIIQKKRTFEPVPIQFSEMKRIDF